MPKYGLSDGLAKLGYMPSHGVFALARPSANVTVCYTAGVAVTRVDVSLQPAGSQAEDSQGNQSDEIEAALKVILPKPYTGELRNLDTHQAPLIWQRRPRPELSRTRQLPVLPYISGAAQGPKCHMVGDTSSLSKAQT